MTEHAINTSLVLYAAAILFAFIYSSISLAIYAFVALMWPVPDTSRENDGYPLIDFAVEITILECIRSDNPSAPIGRLCFCKPGRLASE